MVEEVLGAWMDIVMYNHGLERSNDYGGWTQLKTEIIFIQKGIDLVN